MNKTTTLVSNAQLRLLGWRTNVKVVCACYFSEVRLNGDFPKSGV